MSYSLREINQQIRTDPQGFAQRSDAVYTEKVRKAALKIAARRKVPGGGRYSPGPGEN